MACFHKFYGHIEHRPDRNGLIPAWNFNTLIIGTFNPQNSFHPLNHANYFYGRSRNYLWRILPVFAGCDPIPSFDVEQQITFLQNTHIGLTDLLISIDDADVNSPIHRNQISTVLDRKIESFQNFTWNTNQIINTIQENNIQAVFFTKLGTPRIANPIVNTFESQMRLIENYCHEHNITCIRLFTPSGMGLGKGIPKVNRLIHRWFEDGANHFPFLVRNFDLNDFPYN